MFGTSNLPPGYTLVEINDRFSEPRCECGRELGTNAEYDAGECEGCAPEKFEEENV